jgi:3'-phosphoadenosine 5'-phosphosulfate sulfotransferase (PAPS reductase)/FAD synthetase
MRTQDNLKHYILPDGNVQIAFSGGRTSAYMLHQILKANGDLPDRVEVTFQNTGREREETLEFVAEVSRRWQVSITWLEYRGAKPLFEVVGFQGASRNGEPFDQLIAKKQGLPNQFQAWCSPELKTLTAKRYLVSKGWKKWHSMVGFRADEMHREAFEDNRSTTLLPLRSAGVTKHDVVNFWRHQPFDLGLPTVNGKTIGGNCDGCFKKSEAVIAALHRDEPARARWWMRHEETTRRTFSKRYSRAALETFVQRQGDWIFSTDGALCQADEGECV